MQKTVGFRHTQSLSKPLPLLAAAECKATLPPAAKTANTVQRSCSTHNGTCDKYESFLLRLTPGCNFQQVHKAKVEKLAFHSDQ